jgi:hypothetical protein
MYINMLRTFISIIKKLVYKNVSTYLHLNTIKYVSVQKRKYIYTPSNYNQITYNTSLKKSKKGEKAYCY